MDIKALLYAFALCISLFTLLLAIGIRLLRKQDVHTFIADQERRGFQRRVEQRQKPAGEPTEAVPAE